MDSACKLLSKVIHLLLNFLHSKLVAVLSRLYASHSRQGMVYALHSFLNAHGIACANYEGNVNGYDTLVSDILSRLNRNKSSK